MNDVWRGSAGERGNLPWSTDSIGITKAPDQRVGTRSHGRRRALASRGDDSGSVEHHDEEPQTDRSQTTLLLPYRALVSNTAQRTYIRTILVSFAAFLLALVAATAYTLFYYAYIPQLGFFRPVHLQFDPWPHTDEQVSHPWGAVDISRGELIAGQPYDIQVHLHLPRTEINTEAGNFMLDLQLLGTPSPAAAKPSSKLASAASWMTNALAQEARPEIARSSRPAIMRYVSPMVDTARKAAAIGLHVAGWRQEADWLHVAMFEGVRFAKTADVPRLAKLELKSDTTLWVYDCRIEFRARFGGLRYGFPHLSLMHTRQTNGARRWLMYNHRILSFCLFTTAFWTVEMGATLFIWLICAYAFASAADPAAKAPVVAKLEDDLGLSDTSRSFPTAPGAPPLRFSAATLKAEDEGAPTVKLEEPDAPEPGERAAEAEADDEEDEDADFVLDNLSVMGGRSDSGLGTSYESGAAADAVRRRKRDR